MNVLSFHFAAFYFCWHPINFEENPVLLETPAGNHRTTDVLQLDIFMVLVLFSTLSSTSWCMCTLQEVLEGFIEWQFLVGKESS
jgi:hypothetical protein